MKKVYVNVVTRLIIHADEDANIEEVMENMDYNFTSNNDDADIEDTEIQSWEVTDAK